MASIKQFRKLAEKRGLEGMAWVADLMTSFNRISEIIHNRSAIKSDSMVRSISVQTNMSVAKQCDNHMMKDDFVNMIKYSVNVGENRAFYEAMKDLEMERSFDKIKKDIYDPDKHIHEKSQILNQSLNKYLNGLEDPKFTELQERMALYLNDINFALPTVNLNLIIKILPNEVESKIVVVPAVGDQKILQGQSFGKYVNPLTEDGVEAAVINAVGSLFKHPSPKLAYEDIQEYAENQTIQMPAMKM